MIAFARAMTTVVALLLIGAGIARAGDTFTVETTLGEWTDAARNGRVVPYKLYMPREASSPQPLVIFSHGLGGNRDGAEYLLRYLAEHGYVTIAVQHAGSDTPALMGELKDGDGSMNLDRSDLREKVKATISPQTTMARFQDIPFAIDQLGKMNASTLNGRIDLGRIGMSGHSFGAITTMALAGQVIGGGRMNFADTRITAAIAYSPSKPRQGDATVAFASVKIPTFHMTGTLDKNPLDTAEDPSTRQIPYRSIAGADKFLMVFTDGDHMVYSGLTFRGGPRPTDAKFHALVQKASLAFWDTYLRNAPAARTYLTGGQFARELGSDGTFEFSLR